MFLKSKIFAYEILKPNFTLNNSYNFTYIDLNIIISYKNHVLIIF